MNEATQVLCKMYLSHHSCGEHFIAPGIGCVTAAINLLLFASPIPVNVLKLTHIHSKI